MAHSVNTGKSGEGDEGGGGDQATLKDYLSHIPNIYAKLEEQGMTDINIFLHIQRDELDVLCGKDQGIGLNFMEAMKFKTAIRTLQSELAPKQQEKIVTVHVSEQERKGLYEMEFASRQANGIQNVFSNHLNGIEDNAAQIQSVVDQEFGKIFKKLETRKQSLYKQVLSERILSIYVHIVQGYRDNYNCVLCDYIDSGMEGTKRRKNKERNIKYY